MNTRKNIEGYSLVEVLVAITILLLALVGPMTIAAKGIQSAKYVREQTVAISLAQEGIEAFIAARNDAAIRAFDAGTLSTTGWDWATDGTIDSNCLVVSNVDGCNVDYLTSDPMSSAVACGTDGAGCELYYRDHSSVRAVYSLSSSNGAVLTPYRRAIKVSDTPVGTGLQIESTVYWDTSLFSGQVQSLTLTGEVYDLYE